MTALLVSIAIQSVARLDKSTSTATPEPKIKIHVLHRPVDRNFQRGVRSIRQGIWGPLKAPRSPWVHVFGAKSCNLAISRHFIQTFGKPCF